jgi:hypothetical protein
MKRSSADLFDQRSIGEIRLSRLFSNPKIYFPDAPCTVLGKVSIKI